MASEQRIMETVTLLTANWSKQATKVIIEIFSKVLADVENVDLSYAVAKVLSGDREFMPTAGQVKSIADDQMNRRLREQRMRDEAQARLNPTPSTTSQQPAIDSDRRSWLSKQADDIPFNGDWVEYKRLCDERAKFEWDNKFDWCPGR